MQDPGYEPGMPARARDDKSTMHLLACGMQGRFGRETPRPLDREREHMGLLSFYRFLRGRVRNGGGEGTGNRDIVVNAGDFFLPRLLEREIDLGRYGRMGNAGVFFGLNRIGPLHRHGHHMFVCMGLQDTYGPRVRSPRFPDANLFC